MGLLSNLLLHALVMADLLQRLKVSEGLSFTVDTVMLAPAVIILEHSASKRGCASQCVVKPVLNVG